MSDLATAPQAQSEQERQAMEDMRRVATGFIHEAFAEGQSVGLDGDAMAHAALYAALRELVTTYGEEPVAVFAAGLAEKIRQGRYTETVRH